MIYVFVFKTLIPEKTIIPDIRGKDVLTRQMVYAWVMKLLSECSSTQYEYVGSGLASYI